MIPNLPKKSIILFFLLLLTLTVNSQINKSFNINNLNGLSTNHVYHTLVDQHGYLWIGTTDGVFRYNGYSLTKYDYNDGLSNIDVWNMYEDKAGKIWLLSIGNGLGYIKNNQYHAVTLSRDINTKIYPRNLQEIDSSIVFNNKLLDKDSFMLVCHIINDTIFFKDLYFNQITFVQTIVGDNILFYNDSTAYYYDLNEFLTKSELKEKSPKQKSRVNTVSDYSHYYFTDVAFQRQIFYANPRGEKITFYNPFTQNIKHISIPSPMRNDEYILHAYPKDNFVHVLTNYAAYIIDSTLNINSTYNYHSIFNTEELINTEAVYFYKNSFWGKILSTSNNGLYINNESDHIFKNIEVDLSEHKYIGSIGDTAGYWWRKKDNKLLIMQEGIVKKEIPLHDVFKIVRTIPFNKDSDLMFSGRNMKVLKSNGEMNNFVEFFDTITHNTKKYVVDTMFSYMYYAVTGGLTISDSEFYFISNSWLGLMHAKVDYKKRKITSNTLDINRFDGIIPYPNSDKIICYASDRIIVYNTSSKEKINVTHKHLSSIGIKGIIQLETDDNGNIIILDYDKLYTYTPQKNKLHRLLTNYNLKNARIDVTKNILTVAGNFGVVQCNLISTGEISNLRNYPNTKNLYFRTIKDVQFSNGSVLLNSDQGTYMVRTESYKEHDETKELYRIIINNNNVVSRLYSNDTINISQSINTIGIDVIKPTGTGNLNLSYSIDNRKQTITGNQLVLPHLNADEYHTISINASDFSWASEPLVFYIYVEPKWWQTATAKQIIFVLSLLAIIGLVYVIIVITQKTVTRNNERRNQQRELELKSIYSQINPHFIFNSLSTAQYFVKKNRNKEAYEHINQFSDLLRSYIKSSRNKYITINEEINNLENYLELQLTRFEEKFDYTIEVADSINANTAKIPSLLLQPIVENALNHGIFHLGTKGKLNILFSLENANTLKCIVDDNGIGRKKSKEIRSEMIKKADSYGTVLINELIDTFNKYEKIKIDIVYIDKEQPEQGTTVIIKIKNYDIA